MCLTLLSGSFDRWSSRLDCLFKIYFIAFGDLWPIITSIMQMFLVRCPHLCLAVRAISLLREAYLISIIIIYNANIILLYIAQGLLYFLICTIITIFYDLWRFCRNNNIKYKIFWRDNIYCYTYVFNIPIILKFSFSFLSSLSNNQEVSDALVVKKLFTLSY